MFAHLLKVTGVAVVFAVLLIPDQESLSQPPPPPSDGSDNQGAPPAQNGVAVQERGPVHEAFAAPTAEPKPSPPVAKKPPANIDEMPPEEKPDGDAVWIPGYWGWDSERNDYLWVSGCWRVKPPGKDWVPGYWREQGDQWQWVAGFWANSQSAATQAAASQGTAPVDTQGQAQNVTAAGNAVTYYPQPPAPPAVAAPPPAPAPDMFYVPGAWVWYGGRYAWRAGYWQTGRSGYLWVGANYRWTPYGYIYVPGYWDYAVANRGVFYAPVYVNVGLVGPRFVYTPAYAVADAIVLSALFIQPAYCHYYFGNYYGPRYVGLGFESCFVYSRRCYEPIVAYQVWTYRNNPGWLNVQINLTVARNAGLARIPGREVILRPGREVIVARGQGVARVAAAERFHAMQTARAAHVAAVEHRMNAERAAPGHTLSQPRQVAARTATTPSHTTSATPTSRPGQPSAGHTAPGGYRPAAYGSGGAPGSRPGAASHPGAGPRSGVGPARPGTPGHPQSGPPSKNTRKPPAREPSR